MEHKTGRENSRAPKAAISEPPRDSVFHGTAEWVRPLPWPFTHYLTVSNDCDSTSFETAAGISKYLRSIGLELSDSFFTRTHFGGSIGPLIEETGGPDRETAQRQVWERFGDLWRLVRLDQIHGIVEAAMAVKSPPIVIYPEKGEAQQTIAMEERIGYAHLPVRTISFWCWRPLACRGFEIRFEDQRGSSFLITSGKLGSGQLGWEIDPLKGQPVLVEIDCAEKGLFPAVFESLRVRMRAASEEPLVVADFTASNIGRPAIRRLFKALGDAGIRVPILTGHGQPGHLTEISSNAGRRQGRGFVDQILPSELNFLHFLESNAPSVFGQVKPDRTETQEVLRTLFLGKIGRDRGNSCWSPFYCLDILREYGIRFIRTYFGTTTDLIRIDELVEEYERDGHLFYTFRGYCPQGFDAAPLNSNLDEQIAKALDQIDRSPSFTGGALYTHWGVPVEANAEHVFNQASRVAFENLGSRTRGERASLFLRPLSEMLRYATFIKGLKGNSSYDPETLLLECRSWCDRITGEKFDSGHEFVRGLSFRVGDANLARVFWDGVELNCLERKDPLSDRFEILQVAGISRDSAKEMGNIPSQHSESQPSSRHPG